MDSFNMNELKAHFAQRSVHIIPVINLRKQLVKVMIYTWKIGYLSVTMRISEMY